MKFYLLDNKIRVFSVIRRTYGQTEKLKLKNLRLGT